MQVFLTDKHVIKELNLVDIDSGVDYAIDFISSTNAFVDGLITLDQDTGMYMCDSKTYDYWRAVFKARSQLNRRIAYLISKHGEDAVQTAINDVASCDMADEAAYINAALDDAFCNN